MCERRSLQAALKYVRQSKMNDTANPPMCAGPHLDTRKPKLRLPAKSADCHCHVFGPRDQYPWAANRLFLLDDAPDGVAGLFAAASNALEPEVLRPLLASHALSAELVSELLNNESTKFLEGRQEKLQTAVDDFLARMTESSFEDTPPLDELDLDDADGDSQ